MARPVDNQIGLAQIPRAGRRLERSQWIFIARNVCSGINLDVMTNCPYSAKPLGDEKHADHIDPVSKGGLSTVENMVLVCSDCNLNKHDKTLREFIKLAGFDRDAVKDRLAKLR